MRASSPVVLAQGKKSQSAFTLFEMLITLGVISILVVLMLPVIGKLRARAQRLQCMGNLRSLHIAAEQYLQDNNQWPQISGAKTNPVGYAQKWIAALAPYKLTAKTWICPTVENALGNPNYATPGREACDYFPMPFDDKPLTPHQWPRQPWFVENANAHGNGQLIIFTDGSISDLLTLVNNPKK